MLQLTIVDQHDALADAVRAQDWGNGREIEVLARTDVRSLLLESPSGTAFVSPGNSLGFMDGGIEYVYSREMFPGIEQAVRELIRAGGDTTLLGRPYLPIGNAVVVSTNTQTNTFLIAAPTMWLPQDVRGTRNAYHAMYAALRAAKTVGESLVRRLVCPGLCTGYGKMSCAEAASQMARAYRDFTAGREPEATSVEIAAEQPTWYENTEFKAIPLTDVRFH